MKELRLARLTEPLVALAYLCINSINCDKTTERTKQPIANKDDNRHADIMSVYIIIGNSMLYANRFRHQSAVKVRIFE